MDTTILLEKLIDIERFIGVEPDSVIRRKVIDIEDYILTMHEEAIENLRRAILAAEGDTERLRMEAAVANGRHTAAPYLVWSNPSTSGASTPYRLPLPPPCA
jgi:hypothetical protein